jgi:ParB/RepB/Spo0J family partition protein
MNDRTEHAINTATDALWDDDSDTATPTVATSQLPAPTLDVLPLDHLRESVFNPRTRFDQAKLLELSESLKSTGLIEPISVRRVRSGAAEYFEIAGGHRRFRAAGMAGLAFVPCLVREMDDKQFIKLLNVDNLQREDLHALEEAEGFRTMMVELGYDVKDIVRECNRSDQYVYDRLHLLRLIPDAKALFLDDRFTLGHAILISRQSDAVQELIVGEEGNRQYGGALWKGEATGSLFRPDDNTQDDDEFIGLGTVSVKELEAWIARHVRLDLADAVLPTLFPETVKKVEASAEAGEKMVFISYSRQLAPDAKSADKTFLLDAWRRADGEDNTDTCDHAVLGVIVEGAGRGECFEVCLAKKKCEIHWGPEIAAARKADKLKEKSSAGDPKATAKLAAQQKADEERKRKQLEEQRAAAREQAALTEAILAKITKVSANPSGPIGTLLIDAYSRVGTMHQLPPIGKTPETLLRHITALTVLEDIGRNAWRGGRERTLAKHFGVDVKAIAKAAAKPVCLYCKCTPAKGCTLADGLPCGWHSHAPSVCSNPKCVAAHKKAGGAVRIID